MAKSFLIYQNGCNVTAKSFAVVRSTFHKLLHQEWQYLILFSSLLDLMHFPIHLGFRGYITGSDIQAFNQSFATRVDSAWCNLPLVFKFQECG